MFNQFNLFKKIGSTILGVKPAELRNVLFFEDQDNKWQECKEDISTYSQIRVLELRRLQNKLQVLFYHPLALNQQLTEQQNLDFLQQLGYPRNYTLAGYLYHLTNRLQKEEFPHEIGIFLGYPLQDVLGFIGEVDLEQTGKGAWKIYGDLTSSLLRQNKFKLAQRVFINRYLYN
ncbi:DUF3793 family protein [Halanaerobaculum tunisiense]